MRPEDNTFFERAMRQAREIIDNPSEIISLIDRAFKKALNLSSENSEIRKLTNKVRILADMMRAYANGEYREIPWKTLAIMAAGLIYFINPFDLVPDFIPGVGYLDDLSIILWIFHSLEGDILRFSDFYYNTSETIE